MKNLTTVVGTAATALALGLAAVGCGTDSSGDKSTVKPATSAEATTATTSAEPTGSAAKAGPVRTLDDYLKEHNIKKTVIRPGEPGPTIRLPVPPGWTRAAPSADAPYGGLVLSKPVSPKDPPRIKASLFKLTGDVDQAQVLALASDALKSIPGFQSLGDSDDDELGGFKAAQSGGGYTKDGNSRLIAQKTVAIPARGGMFIYQLTADGLESDMGPLMTATSVIDRETKITP